MKELKSPVDAALGVHRLKGEGERYKDAWSLVSEQHIECNRQDIRNEINSRTVERRFDFTSYVEIGRSGVTGPSAVHGNTLVFPLVGLLAVLNLQSSCVED